LARKAVIMHVNGLVQGVSFRASLAEVARSSNVSGWVRNRLDGRVEAFLEGEAESVDTVLAWARRGPPHARVDRLDAIDRPLANIRGFRVKGQL
jgi:acylphosphatase